MANGLTFLRYDRLGLAPQGEFSAGVTDYRQQWLEGPAEASWYFELPDGSGVQSWFNSYFMNQVRVYEGASEIWRGWVWTMEAITPGGTLYGSMGDVNNRIKVRRTNSEGKTDYRPKELFTGGSPGGEEWTVPAWASHQKSVDTYGPLEYIASTSTTDSDEAEAYARMLLARTSAPYQAPPAAVVSNRNVLSVTCIGAVGLANRIMLSDGYIMYTFTEPDGDFPADNNADADDATKLLRYAGEDDPTGRVWGYTGAGYDTDSYTVGDEVRRVVRVLQAATGGLIYPLDLAANDTATAAGVSSVTGAWDRLRELAATPNSDGEGYVLQMTVDGGVIYKRLLDLPVMYRAFPNGDGVRHLDGSIPRWQARPGIMEMVGNWGVRLPGTYTDYADGSVTVEDAPPYLPAGQVYAERVDMGDGDEVASFNARQETPTDYRRALDRELRRYKRAS